MDRDSASELRSAADGGSLRSVAQGSARSPQEPTNVALYQVGASATPTPRPGDGRSLSGPYAPP